jgi:glucose-6-phosphate isomerase
MENYDSLTNHPTVKLLQDHFENLKGTHLRQLLSDNNRNNSLVTTFDNIILDYTHLKVNDETLSLLQQLSDELKLMDRFEAMYRGDKINTTENRSVLHYALRKPETEKLVLDGNDIIPEVHSVLHRIKEFSENVRSN